MESGFGNGMSLEHRSQLRFHGDGFPSHEFTSDFRLAALASLITLAGAARPTPFRPSAGSAGLPSAARPTPSTGSPRLRRSRRQAAGGKVIEFYPGQALSPEDRTTKMDHAMPAEAIQKLRKSSGNMA